MTERQIATVQDYDGLIDAVRLVMELRGVTCEELDAQSGLQPGYTGKLTGPGRIKNLGPLSMGLVLQTLGIKLHVVVDDVKIAKVPEERTKRVRAARRARPSSRATERKFPQELFATLGRRSGSRRMTSVPAHVRRRVARKAARARWRKERRKGK